MSRGIRMHIKLDEIGIPAARRPVDEDFEWDFEVWSRETGLDRHASNHYETATDAHTAAEIIERTKDRFANAAANCVLFMWATIPLLATAIDVLRMRGFHYVSHYIWRKPRIGMGYLGTWSLILKRTARQPCPVKMRAA
jgi:N6-adenosine-specific RNA methylase IME4